MKQYKLGIEGMACTMCEAHIKDVIYNNVSDAKKVHADFRKGEASFVSEKVDIEKLKDKIGETGYSLTSVSEEEYQKKRWFGR